MRRVAALGLVCAVLVALSHGASATTVVGTLGSATSVTANTETTITYGTFNLVVTVSTASDVTLSSYASVATAMPSGYTALAFTAQAGFTLAYTGGGTLVKARLTTPPVTTATATAITGSATAGCLRYDVDARTYSKVAIDSYTATRTIVVDLPAAGTYVFAAVSASAAIPTFYAEARATSSVDATFQYPGGFSLVASTSVANSVTVTRRSYSNFTDPSSKRNLGAFFHIDRSSASGTVSATLRYTYDASIDASAGANLRFAFYNTGTASWEFPGSGASVDTNTRVVSQTTTHFSEWAVFASGDGDELSETNQPLNPASPSKCYAVDYTHTLGVMNFKLTKVDGGGALRMYLLKGDQCPSASSYQMRTDPTITQDGQSRSLCLTGDTTPQASSGRFMVAVYAEGLSGAGSQTRFNLRVSSDVVCNSAGVARLSALALLFALVLSVLASDTWWPSL